MGERWSAPSTISMTHVPHNPFPWQLIFWSMPLYTGTSWSSATLRRFAYCPQSTFLPAFKNSTIGINLLCDHGIKSIYENWRRFATVSAPHHDSGRTQAAPVEFVEH